MKTLGIYYGHTATAVYMEDGIVKNAVSEERFTNVKNQNGIPRKAISWILKTNQLNPKDIDVISIPVKTNAPIYASRDSKANLLIKFLNFCYYRVPLLKNTSGLTSFYNPRLRWLGRLFYRIFSSTIGAKTSSLERATIAKFLGVDVGKIKTYDHHTCHAFSAYYGSPFSDSEALVLTLDAEGDGIAATVNIFNKDSYRRLSSSDSSNSLGWLFHAVTAHLGMKPWEHEYKVMGLAPYAKGVEVDKVYQRVKDLFAIGGRTGFEFVSRFDTHQSPRFLKENMAGVRFDVLAAVFQKLVEDKIVEWVRKCVENTKVKRVCLAGGVFMNVKANQKIMEMTEVDELFVFPSCGDESSPIGACYLAEKDLRETTSYKPIPITNVYFGPSFSNNEIKMFIDEEKIDSKYQVRYFDDVEKEIARLLFEGKILARLSGAMEWGARALGNRSILANPSDQDVVMVINEQVKNRDFWMPFAPSILKENETDYIINPKNINASFMMISFESTALARKKIRATLHPYDFTCRPQIVTSETNPKYHKLISEFKELTGTGAVLNTSFNLHGYPIVLGPREALWVFENSGLQYLELENFIVSKKNL